ncbi:hypothetical protein G7Y89_g3529 [Cudoniella acicularis]|uniref:Uncharacterized protein n=1 Tax=Cudoniella acicularis TaxID=354080 RepID=A0A8H4RU63_9HELO|nr:hypothetical protein G7Y89_g3529 [Cudoniella acicularis]
MSASPNTTSVDLTRTMPGSFEKFGEETEHDPQTTSTTETPYMAKSTQANQAPTWDNIRAAFFSWLTLARPGLLHSLTGLITTLINIYTAQGRHWSVTAKITIIVIGLCTGNMTVLYLVYNHWILEKMKTTRDRALAKRNRT